MNDLTQFLMSHGGPVLFGIVFAEQAGLPLPSAPWLLAAGALSAAGKLNPVMALAMTTLACVVADSIWFYVGRRGGQRVLRPFCRLSLAPNPCVGRTKDLFARHGLQALVAAKFIPGLGAVMPPLAGALGIPTGRFLLLDGLGSLFYGGFYIGAGFLFHNQLQEMMAMLNQLGFSALLLALVLVPGYIVFKYVRRRRPLIGPIHHRNVRETEADAIEENEGVARKIATQGTGHIVGDKTGALNRESVVLALTSTTSQSTRDDATSSLVQTAPSGL
jgi:membrane protein DedA with SNARE-associated domain